MYSVTQSYANSFSGDVVLDTFNSVSRDEDFRQISIRNRNYFFIKCCLNCRLDFDLHGFIHSQLGFYPCSM